MKNIVVLEEAKLHHKVGVVLPAYNEEENIERAVKEFRKYASDVFVADNNSNDKTGELAKKAGAKVFLETRQGYGFALRRGMEEAVKAGADVVILSEPDGTFQARDIEKLLSYINDFDLVLGTRTSKYMIGKGANMGIFLKWGNYFVAKLMQVLYNGPSLTDVGCTMRAVKADALKNIMDKFKVGGSHFSPEMMVLALKEGIRTIEIPLNYGSRIGTSKITGKKMKAFKLGLKMIWLIVSYKFKK